MDSYPPEVSRDTYDDHVVIWHCEPPVMYGHFFVAPRGDVWDWDSHTGLPYRHIFEWITTSNHVELSADAG